MTDTKQVEEVTAEVIPDVADLQIYRETEGWLGHVADRVASVVGVYQAPTAITSREDYQQAKRERAAVRRTIKDVTDEKRQKTAAVRDVLRLINERTDAALADANATDKAYKQAIDAFDEQTREHRAAELEEFYTDLAPMLAGLVPFSELRSRYAAEDGWFKASVTDETARELVEKRVNAIAEGERKLDALIYDSPAERESARARYFETLDYMGTVVWTQEQRDRAAKLAELDLARGIPASDEPTETAPEPICDATEHDRAPEPYRVECKKPREGERVAVAYMPNADVPEFAETMKRHGWRGKVVKRER